MEGGRSRSADDGCSLPIAIIGLAFEFPQEATSAEAFWEMLCEGRSSDTKFPQNRLNIDAFYHPDGSRPSSVSHPSLTNLDVHESKLTVVVRSQCEVGTSSRRI